MNLSDMMVKCYEDAFGKGSWAELEAGVRARHPEIFDAIYDEPCLPPPRWWQFWK